MILMIIKPNDWQFKYSWKKVSLVQHNFDQSEKSNYEYFGEMKLKESLGIYLKRFIGGKTQRTTNVDTVETRLTMTIS